MAKKKHDRVVLEVRLAEVDETSYRPQHVEVSSLSALQGQVLKRLHWALQADGIRLKNGRFVQHSSDAIRYLLERIGEESMEGQGL